MEYLKLTRTHEDEIIHKAIEILKKGGIIAFPTETFYGLGAKYDNEKALKRLYELKRRPFEKAIPVIISSQDRIDLIAEDVPDEAKALMKKYWPGPLTIILKAKEGISRYLTANTNKIAVRIPGESFALSIAKNINFPITATSANLSGVPPANDAQDVLQYFGETIDLLVDGGQTFGLEPSTIVEIIAGEVKILRKGRIKKVILD